RCRAGIAGGRDRDVADAELGGACDRECKPARLEAAGRILPLVLDENATHPELIREAWCIEQWREAFAERETVARIAHRQHFGIAPQCGHPAHESLRPERGTQTIEIVARVEWHRAARRDAQLLL